jgi:hypothetical protein
MWASRPGEDRRRRRVAAILLAMYSIRDEKSSSEADVDEAVDLDELVDDDEVADEAVVDASEADEAVDDDEAVDASELDDEEELDDAELDDEELDLFMLCIASHCDASNTIFSCCRSSKHSVKFLTISCNDALTLSACVDLGFRARWRLQSAMASTTFPMAWYPIALCRKQSARNHGGIVPPLASFISISISIFRFFICICIFFFFFFVVFFVEPSTSFDRCRIDSS